MRKQHCRYKRHVQITNNTQFSFLIFSASLIFFSCVKSSSSADLDGDWAREYEYEGVGRTEAVSFTIGDTVYVGGGYDGTDRLNDFWRFDINTGSWIRVADFPGTPRNSAVGFSINGKGYIGTGYDDNDNKLKDFWEYNPATNTWTQKADFAGTARYNAIGFSLNGKGFIGTGYDGNYLKDLWQYDPAADEWVQKASLAGSKRSEALVFVYNDKAYVVTGNNNGSYLNDFWMYDAGSDSWTEKRKITDVTDESYDDDYGNNIIRANAVIFLINKKAYITCGNYNGIRNTTWEYDIDNDTWDEKTAFEGSGREGAIGFTTNNRGFIVSGNNSSSYFDDVWEFYPDAEQDNNNN